MWQELKAMEHGPSVRRSNGTDQGMTARSTITHVPWLLAATRDVSKASATQTLLGQLASGHMVCGREAVEALRENRLGCASVVDDLLADPHE